VAAVLPTPTMDRGPEKAIGNPLFVVLRARRSCISVASGCIETPQPQDACWHHAEWARPLRQSRVLRGTNMAGGRVNSVSNVGAGFPACRFLSLGPASCRSFPVRRVAAAFTIAVVDRGPEKATPRDASAAKQSQDVPPALFPKISYTGSQIIAKKETIWWRRPAQNAGLPVMSW
jgi:hypothetical protein